MSLSRQMTPLSLDIVHQSCDEERPLPCLNTSHATINQSPLAKRQPLSEYAQTSIQNGTLASPLSVCRESRVHPTFMKMQTLVHKFQFLHLEAKGTHNNLCYHVICRRHSYDSRSTIGHDLFAKVPILSKDKPDSSTLKNKFKQHSMRRQTNSSKRDRYHEVVSFQTMVNTVPPYRFHHIHIYKNISTPQTMLKYVPHIRDLDTSEEHAYDIWLKELADMDEASGFKTLSREEKVLSMQKTEYISNLYSTLPVWVKRLNLPNCTMVTLAKYVKNKEAHKNLVEHGDEHSHSHVTDYYLHLFSEAFDQHFNLPERKVVSVSLKMVLSQEETINMILHEETPASDSFLIQKPICDANTTPTDSTSTSFCAPSPQSLLPTYADISFDNHKNKGIQVVEKILETHTLLSCLICFSHSCDHGEYDNKNAKRTFSMELWGGIDGNHKRRRTFAKEDLNILSSPCSHDCFLNVASSSSDSQISKHPSTEYLKETPLSYSWSQDECRAFMALSGCPTATKKQRPTSCTFARYINRPCNEVHKYAERMGLYISEPTEMISRGSQSVKDLPWYDRQKKQLIGDWKDHTVSHEHQRREVLEPCNHSGPCTRAKRCPCVLAGLLCERFCRCTYDTCAYKFTGCACNKSGKSCHSKQKERPCVCVQLNRECDPLLCGSCGVDERVTPANITNRYLMKTGCQNCSLQRGDQRKVILASSQLPGVGYGLIAGENISQDDFITEYTGELITHDEGVRREARRGHVFNQEPHNSYLFTLLDQEGIWVDAAVYGNLSRYINHAPTGSDRRGSIRCNLVPKIIYVNGEFRIRFTASRDIQVGEELFFDYGENFPNLTQKLLEDRVDVDLPTNPASISTAKKASRRNNETARPRNDEANRANEPIQYRKHKENQEEATTKYTAGSCTKISTHSAKYKSERFNSSKGSTSSSISRSTFANQKRKAAYDIAYTRRKKRRYD